MYARPPGAREEAKVTVTDQQWTDATRKGTGWLAFAGAMLVVSGTFKIFDALWAFKYDDEISERVQTILFEDDLQAWGWVWLVVGVVLFFAGFAVFSGAEWARWVGIVAASVAAITFMPWIYYQPFWTMLSVALAVLVVYALAAYGGRQATES
jgi:hypothetical protein